MKSNATKAMLFGLACSCSVPALAQQVQSPAADNSAADSQNQEILVIGTTKQATNIQDVPTAISVFSGDQLAQRNVVNVQDVGSQTPGFLIRQAPSNSSAIVLGLRGQVQNDVLATVDPSVGTYVDGVYWARAYGLNSDILDVSNVQVLKGPQGTLFGRNTSSGALVIETNDPKMNESSLTLDGHYGNFNEAGGSVVFNKSLVQDVLAVRGAANILKRNGTVLGYNPNLPQVNGQFPLTGKKYNNIDNIQGRLKILFRPASNVDVLLGAEIFQSKMHGPGRFLSHFSTALGPAGPALAVYDLAHVDRISVNSALDGITPGTVNGTTQNLYGEPFTDTKTQTYSAKVKVDLGTANLLFTNAYRKIATESAFDLDGTALQRGNNDFDTAIHQYSSELQLSGKAFNNSLEYVIGATYLTESGFDNSQGTTYLGNLTAVPLQKVSNFRSNIKNTAYGVYAQASYHITDKLTLTAGLRHSWDQRQNKSDNQIPINSSGSNDPIGVPVPPSSSGYCLVNFATPPANGSCFLTAKDSYQAWSYTAGIDYKINDDVMIYAKTGKGYRAGAQQLRTVSIASAVASLPEVNIEHEVGLKSQFMDRKVRFNIAAYLNTVKNWQTTKILTTPTNVKYTAVLNPADLRNYGVEVDLSIEPFPGFQFGGALALNNEKYRNCAGGVCPSFVRDVVQTQFDLNASYEHDFGDKKLGLNVNYSWTGKVPLSSDLYKATDIAAALGLPAVAPVLAQLSPLAITDAEWGPIFMRKSAGILNARASLIFNDNMELYVYGRNLTDKRYIQHSQFLFNLTTSSVRNDPRTYGVGMKFKF